MFLVVDVNVIFSAVLNRGNSVNVFIRNNKSRMFDLITPEFLIIELGKHTAEIAQKTNFTLKEAQQALEFIVEQIKFISEEEYKCKLEEAKEILKEHPKDIPYLALALKYDCKIFSGDKIFKTICPDRVKSPKEPLGEFFSQQ